MAAWAYHYADRLPQRERETFFNALLAGWPRRGDEPDLYSGSYAVQLVDRHGVSVDRVADAWDYDNRESAARMLRRARQTSQSPESSASHQWLAVNRARVVLDDADGPPPPDPADDDERMRALLPDWRYEKQQDNASERVLRASCAPVVS